MIGILLANPRPSQLPITRTLTPSQPGRVKFATSTAPHHPPQNWFQTRHHQSSVARITPLRRSQFTPRIVLSGFPGAHQNVFPVRVPIIVISLAGQKPSELPIMRTLTPFQSGRAQSFHQDCFSDSATLAKSSTPPAMPLAYALLCHTRAVFRV